MENRKYIYTELNSNYLIEVNDYCGQETPMMEKMYSFENAEFLAFHFFWHLKNYIDTDFVIDKEEVEPQEICRNGLPQLQTIIEKLKDGECLFIPFHFKNNKDYSFCVCLLVVDNF